MSVRTTQPLDTCLFQTFQNSFCATVLGQLFDEKLKFSKYKIQDGVCMSSLRTVIFYANTNHHQGNYTKFLPYGSPFTQEIHN